MAYPNRKVASGLWKLIDFKSYVQTSNFPTAGDRVLGAGGATPSLVNTIDYVEVTTTGNSTDFGDMRSVRQEHSAAGNNVRSIIHGGNSEPATSDDMEYFVPSTQGNTAFFGDATIAHNQNVAYANSIRGLNMGGETPSITNVIDYYTIASVGNAVDFGDLTGNSRIAHSGSIGSPTRAIYAGGKTPSFTNVIQYITPTTTGNAVDFGDLTETRGQQAAHSSPTRGLTMCGFNGSGTVNKIEYITIASHGDSADFGDCSATTTMPGGGGNLTRAIRQGGGEGTYPSLPAANTIDLITMSTTGDSTDFGNLTAARKNLASAAQNHGGISIHGGSPRLGIDHAGDRGFAMGGATPSAVNVIDMFGLATTGNAIDFGDLTGTSTQGSGAGGIIKALRMSGTTGGSVSVTTDAIFFQSQGNAADFGDSTAGRMRGGGLSNSTRAVHGGGHTPTKVNTIDYYTMASSGGATDFGDMAAAVTQVGSTASTTRGVFGGGNPGSDSNVMQYITIASTGDTTDFGDLTVARSGLSGSGSDTRGLFGGAYPVSNVIDYITISSTGDAADFGDLTAARGGNTGSLSNKTRGLFAGGYQHPASPATSNVIDYVTIASTGNAADHGDLTAGKQNLAQASNGHGGL